MLAGGIGGTTGDILMHSLDTVKTRQQGDPHFPPRYNSLSDSYVKIFRQEGLRRGLYGGFTAAMLGSFPGTVVFFGSYEYCKRQMLDRGLNPSIAFLASGKAHFHLSLMHMLTVFCRLLGRFCCLDRICTLRSPQNPTAAARSLQQPFLQLWL